MLTNTNSFADITRPLGAVEKMFWPMDQNHPMHFVLIAEVVGRNEIGQWQEALDNLCQQLPLVWSRILSDDTGEPHFRKSVAGAIPLEVVIMHRPTGLL